MGNQFTNIFSNYKLERVKFFGNGVLIFRIVILPFCLIKKVRKNQDQTMLLPTGLYAGPPFGRAVALAFYHPGLRAPLRGRGIFVGDFVMLV
jgi:hypothetical protein